MGSRRLQADAARVVHDALADESEVTGCLALGRIGQLDHAGLLDGTLVHAEQTAAAELDERRLVEEFDAESEARAELYGDLAEIGRGEVPRRGVGEVARDDRGPRARERRRRAVHDGRGIRRRQVQGELDQRRVRRGRLENAVAVAREQRRPRRSRGPWRAGRASGRVTTSARRWRREAARANAAARSRSLAVSSFEASPGSDRDEVGTRRRRDHERLARLRGRSPRGSSASRSRPSADGTSPSMNTV